MVLLTGSMSQPDTLDQTEPSTLPTSPTALLALAHQPLQAYLAFLRKEAALASVRKTVSSSPGLPA